MKKIVGILCAAAMFTASVFAADVAAKIKFDGTLFEFKGADNTFNALGLRHGGESWNPNLSVALWGEKAGGSFGIYDPSSILVNNQYGVDMNKQNEVVTNFFLYFKPLEGLAVNVGYFEPVLNQEMIDWDGTKTKMENTGYGLAYNNAGFFAEVALMTGLSGSGNWGGYYGSSSRWLTIENNEATFNQTFFKAGYGADFGTIGAIAWYKGGEAWEFALGYNKGLSNMMFFVNAIANINSNKFESVIPEVYAQGNVDAFGWAVFAQSVIPLEEPETTSLFVKAKLSYTFDNITAYLYLRDNNILADDFELEIKPGITGNLGGMDWEVALDFHAKAKPDFEIPVSLTLAF